MNATVKWALEYTELNRYFTREELVRCNVCGNHHRGEVNILLAHLISAHRPIIEKLRNEIKHTELSRYFAFDVGCVNTRCIRCDEEISIFAGMKNLEDHLLLHHKIAIQEATLKLNHWTN